MCAHTQMGCVCAHTRTQRRGLRPDIRRLAGSRRPASDFAGKAGPAGAAQRQLAREASSRDHELSESTGSKPELANFEVVGSQAARSSVARQPERSTAETPRSRFRYTGSSTAVYALPLANRTLPRSFHAACRTQGAKPQGLKLKVKRQARFEFDYI